MTHPFVAGQVGFLDRLVRGRANAIFLLLLTLALGCRRPQGELCLLDATLLLPDGTVAAHQAVLINADTIVAILPADATYTADSTLYCGGRLLTPGLIAINEHLDDVYGGYVDSLPMDSVRFEDYAAQFAQTYLPYGVTTVRTSGDPEEWLPLALYLQENRSSQRPDVWVSGGTLTSPYDGWRYQNHAFLPDCDAALATVQRYHKLGIRQLKVFGNLRQDVYLCALREAQRLGMHVSSQVQNATHIGFALRAGLRNFEQVATLLQDSSVRDVASDSAFQASLAATWDDGSGNLRFDGVRIYPALEAARHLGANHPGLLALADSLKLYGAGMVPCLHFYGQWVGETWFRSTPKSVRFETKDWNEVQRQHCREGYAVMAALTYHLWRLGVPLRIGTDHRDGGKAVLSEMLLLEKAGIPMAAVLRIATQNGAEAIGEGGSVGGIAVGKRANLVLFEGNPLFQPTDLLGKKTVIKDGKVVHLQENVHFPEPKWEL